MLPDDALPGQCHPALATDADFIRQWMRRRGNDTLVIPYFVGPRLIARAFEVDPGEVTEVGESIRTRLPKYPTPEISRMGKHVLTKRKAAAPVPYVGPRQTLWWWVMTDELGRSVASHEVHRVQDPYACVYGPWPRGWPTRWNVPADDDLDA